MAFLNYVPQVRHFCQTQHAKKYYGFFVKLSVNIPTQISGLRHKWHLLIFRPGTTADEKPSDACFRFKNID